MPSPSSKRLIALCGLGFLLVGAGFWYQQSLKRRAPAVSADAALPVDVRSAETKQLLRDAELDPAKQKKIWDCEQVTFELETQFGKPFAKAWAKKDRAGIDRFLRSDFKGVTYSGEQVESRQVGTVSSARSRAEGATPVNVNSSGMINYFLELVKDYDHVERSKVRVLKIDNVGNDTNRWTTRLLLTAAGHDAQGRLLDHASEHIVEFRFTNTDQITSEGKIVADWVVEKRESRVVQKPVLEEITDKVGLGGLSLPDNWKLPADQSFQYRFQIGVEDFNRDGFPDIAVALDDGRPLLLRSAEGARFEEVSSSLGLQRWDNKQTKSPTFLTAWIDFNNDGYADLILGPRLYENRGGTNFLDITAQSGLDFKFDPMGAVIADYDCDGLTDLYVLYQHPDSPPKIGELLPWVGDTQSGTENHLWRNLGNGRFENVTTKANAGGGKGRTFAASWLFFDEDRFPDLYIANDFGNNVLLRNRGDGTFEDITKETTAGSFSTSMGVATGDIDNDGSPEIYVANMFSKMGRRIIGHVQASDYPAGVYEQIVGSCQGNTLFRRTQGDSRYTEVGTDMGVNQVGWAYAPAFVDLDGDGLLDIYATAGFMSFDRTKPDG